MVVNHHPQFHPQASGLAEGCFCPGQDVDDADKTRFLTSLCCTTLILHNMTSPFSGHVQDRNWILSRVWPRRPMGSPSKVR